MVGIFTESHERNRRLDTFGLDAYHSSLGDVVDATAEESWLRNPTTSAWRWLARQKRDYNDSILSAEDATQRFGIDGHLSFAEPIAERHARELVDLKRSELARQDVIARGEGGFIQGAAELGTGFVVSALDPINVASAFVPVVAPARYALWLAGAGSAGARAAVRMGAGALEGAVGAAMVEPLVYGVAMEEHADYGAVDSLLNVAFGTALGGGLHVGAGAIGGRWNVWKGKVPGYESTVDAEARRRLTGPMAEPDSYVAQSFEAFGMSRPDASQLERALAAAKPETREALLRAAVAHVAEGRPVSVKALAGLDPALRGEMLDVGRVVEAAIDDPLGPFDAAVARLSPDVMEEVLFRKGEAFITTDGDLATEGNLFKRQMGGHEPSLGAVKLMVKHGEYSAKAGTPRQLWRDDILMLPRILREFTPVPDKVRTSETGAVTAHQWVVRRSDGELVRYVLNRDSTGEMVTATIHVLDEPDGVNLSEKRVAPKASPRGLSSRDTEAAGIAHRPTEAAGATRQSYTRPPWRGQARQGMSAHQPHPVFDADGRRIMVRYQLIEADELVVSHTDDLRENPAFPSELQPRDRGRAAAESQINDIVANFEPERLGVSSDAATGAPMVGKDDNLVESGNGRVLAIRRVLAEGGANAERYRAFLARLGFDDRTMRAPVLVRRRLDELSLEDRRAFTVAAQKSGTLDLSTSERAMADSRRMDGILHLLDGDPALARNADFVRAFQRQLPQAEQGQMMTGDGRLSIDGRRRVEAALLARAYDDPDLLARMLEVDDDNSRAIVGALLDVAPDWATMRAAAAKGEIAPTADVTAELVAAVRAVRDARTTGRPLAEIRSQADMFNARSSVADRFLGVLLREAGEGRVRTASREAIAGDLRHFIDQAMQSHPTPDMFGTKPPTGAELLDLLKRDMPDGVHVDAEDGDAMAAVDKLLADHAGGARNSSGSPAEPGGKADDIDDSLIDADLDRAMAEGLIEPDHPDLAEIKTLLDDAAGETRALDAAAICLARSFT